MSQHLGFGGCQGTEGEIAHTINISKNTLCVNSLTYSQYVTSFGVCAFVLKSWHEHTLAEGPRRGRGGLDLTPPPSRSTPVGLSRGEASLAAKILVWTRAASLIQTLLYATKQLKFGTMEVCRKLTITNWLNV
jgi:hypothetical protein